PSTTGVRVMVATVGVLDTLSGVPEAGSMVVGLLLSTSKATSSARIMIARAKTTFSTLCPVGSFLAVAGAGVGAAGIGFNGVAAGISVCAVGGSPQLEHGSLGERRLPHFAQKRSAPCAIAHLLFAALQRGISVPAALHDVRFFPSETHHPAH